MCKFKGNVAILSSLSVSHNIELCTVLSPPYGLGKCNSSNIHTITSRYGPVFMVSYTSLSATFLWFPSNDK